MSTFNKKWSELTKQEKQAAKTTYGDNAKQQWQDAKARSKGFKNEQDRRGNTGERHRANNPSTPAPTPSPAPTPAPTPTPSPAPTNQYGDPVGTNYKGGSPIFNESTGQNESYTGADGTVTTLSNTQENQATNGLHARLGLNTDSNASYEDTRSQYQNIDRNRRMYGPAAGRDIYAEAGLKNPMAFNNEWNKDPNAFRKKYGVDRIEEVWAATGKVQNESGGWTTPNTLDKATINLDPEAYGKLGQQVNDEEFKKTFDYSSSATIQVNALGGKSYGTEKDKLENQYGVSLNEYNKGINPNDDTNYNHSPTQRLGRMDYFIDTVANKYNAPWALERNKLRGNNYEYGKGYYEQVDKGGLPGGKAPLQESGKQFLSLNYSFDPNRFYQGQ